MTNKLVRYKKIVEASQKHLVIASPELENKILEDDGSPNEVFQKRLEDLSKIFQRAKKITAYKSSRGVSYRVFFPDEDANQIYFKELKDLAKLTYISHVYNTSLGNLHYLQILPK